MYLEEIGNSITFQLRNIAFLRFDRLSEYVNVISPFTRIYLITEGHGSITVGREKYVLEPGYIYLIPSFTPCTYLFEKDLAHYYIHFSVMIQNGLNIYTNYKIHTKVQCTEINRLLFERLLEINPDLQLPHHDPRVYQQKPWINKKVRYNSVSQHLDSLGILFQLFSAFLQPGEIINARELLRYNLHEILMFIQTNLQNDISISELACKACLSRDHFTRIFKSIIGMAPYEFIIRKRIEKAQFLLLTTNMTQDQIVAETNFKSLSYFSRMFKKYTSYTPGGFRQER